jgi:hypothetical protein
LKHRFFVGGEEEGEGVVAGGEFLESEFVEGFVEVDVEVVDPEFIEVAEDGVLGAVGDEFDPVVEGLLAVEGEGDAAFFHFDEDDGFPDVVGEGGAAGVFLAGLDAEFRLAADIEGAALSEGDEEAVEEDLGLAFFVAGDVGGGPINEGLEA